MVLLQISTKQGNDKYICRDLNPLLNETVIIKMALLIPFEIRYEFHLL